MTGRKTLRTLVTIAISWLAPFSAFAATANVNVGQRITFAASAQGSAPFSYQWKKNGTSIGGATGSTYVIASAATADAATYTVTVANSAGSSTAPGATITVAGTTAPAIATQPLPISVALGQRATFAVVATGTNLTYQWRKNGTNISGATGATHVIAAAAASDAATYSVVVSNAGGSVTSSGAALSVTSALVRPSITTQPTSKTASVGQVVSFSVSASGSAPFTYQWRKNGTNLSGATGATYTIAGVTSSSGGAYSVVVSNAAGSATSASATLTVSSTSAPQITAQPASLTVATGGSATFHVTASGSGTLSYQWRKNGTNISGATSSTYTIASTTSASAGSYSVVVTNSAGSATSNSATLTVSSGSTTGLVAAYSFNEGAGFAAKDSSGKANHGATSGTTWSATGKFGSALWFNGSNARVTVNDSATLDLTTGMTLEAWVYPVASGGWRDIIYKANDMYYLMGSSDGANVPSAGGTFSTNEVFGTSALALNTWTHVAATYDGATVRLYINGVQVASRAQTGAIRTSSSPLTIGGDAVYGQFWSGRIDEVRVYNRALSQTEIQRDMNTAVPTAP